MKVQSTHGYLMILAAATLWGSLGIFAKLLYQLDLTPLQITTYRVVISTVLLILVVPAIDRRLLRIRAVDLPFFALYGLISVGLFHYLYNFAISRTSVATAAILLYTAPAHVVLISAYVFGEKLTLPKWVALGCTLGGAALVSGVLGTGLPGDLPGILAGLGSGLTYGLYSIFGKKAVQRYNSWTVLVYSFFFGAIFLLGFSSLTGGIRTDLPISAWTLLVSLGLFPTVLAYTSYLAGLRLVEAGRAAIVATWEPVMAAILGYVVLGESLGPAQVAGGGLVLVGVLLAQRQGTGGNRPKEAKEEDGSYTQEAL